MAKKGTLQNFWTQFGILYYKEVSKFVIPAFRYKLLVPKITKCRDLLYSDHVSDKHPQSENINGHALDVLIEVFLIWRWVTNLTQKLFLSKLNVQIMRLINTLKVGLNRTSRPIPVVREFSNVWIPDFQFFFSSWTVDI